jgi:DHA1 family tetracycline resistance protein-like MFS transporter
MAQTPALSPADVPPGAGEAVPAGGAPPRGRQAAIAFIFVAVTIDTISMGITAPVLPTLIKQMSGGSMNAGLMNGLFMTVFALMQFIFSPILGGLSDRYGRRPILLLSIAGLGLSYAGMGMATSIWQLLLIRVFTGATSANIATAFAYVADVTPPERRAGAYGLMQAAMSLGFACGPAIGGLLASFGPSAPFWAAALCSLVNAAYGFFVVPESLAKDRRAPFHPRSLASFSALSILRSKPNLLSLALILALAQFAVMVFPTDFVLYAQDRYHWNIGAVSAVLSAFGVCSALVQAFLSGRIVRQFGERRVVLFGLACGIIGLANFGFAPTGLIFCIGIPIMTLWGVSGPAVQALMTRQVSASEQGRLQGANTSLGSLSGIMAPLIFGGLYSAVSSGWGGGGGSHLLGAPFVLAGVIVLIALLLAARSMPKMRSRL